MHHYYKEYRWQKGKPLGITQTENLSGTTYRIVADPYQKWITLEAYLEGHFQRLIYDSRFLDFRKLTPTDQAAWRKEKISEEEAWIFNEDDRLILHERCSDKEILISSPYGFLVARYELPEGAEGAITLYDSNGHVVIQREAGPVLRQE